MDAISWATVALPEGLLGYNAHIRARVAHPVTIAAVFFM
jgi:hypothetical protein